MGNKLIWQAAIALGLGVFSLVGLGLAYRIWQNPGDIDAGRALDLSLAMILLFHFSAFFTLVRMVVYLRRSMEK
ncbi:hypothetical protein JW992_07715 [candidate division KSB1 bacterium]|nr:hypothetical protein [candidate division KSB1 bacterium]